MFCQKCGVENKDDSTFCKACGASLNGDEIKDKTIPFSPVERGYDRKHLNVIYGECVGKSVYYFNVVAIWILLGLNIIEAIVDPTKFFLIIGFVIAAVLWYYWIAPSGIRRVYNKTEGSRTASNIAFLLCTWIGIFGWLICWGYENW
jgi:hypothetical protein